MSDQHSAGEQVCTICGDPTELACSDCRIDLKTSVYVCHKSACRDEHQRVCTESISDLQVQVRALTAAIADAKLAGELAMRPLVEAAKNLLEACYQADAREELPHEISGDLMDAVRNSLIAVGAELTAHAADAKLAGELAMRESIGEHYPIFHDNGERYFTCHECGWDSRKANEIGWTAHIRNLPLTPDSAGVLERIKKEAVAQFAQDAGQDIRTNGTYRLERPEMQVLRDAVERIKRAEQAQARLEEHDLLCQKYVYWSEPPRGIYSEHYGQGRCSESPQCCKKAVLSCERRIALLAEQAAIADEATKENQHGNV